MEANCIKKRMNTHVSYNNLHNEHKTRQSYSTVMLLRKYRYYVNEVIICRI